jgi:nickel-type superoxide dismutase maturation protease
MGASPPSDEPSAETYHRGRKRRQAAAAGVVVGLGLVYGIVRWRPSRVEVSGTSMSPTLEPGDWALAVESGRIRRGDVVVLEHPGRPGFEMVKRITGMPDELAPDGRILEADEYWAEGDNPDGSTDSRHFGPVPRDLVKAHVTLVYWPRARRRILGRGRTGPQSSQ